jgi:hypothetical protein
MVDGYLPYPGFTCHIQDLRAILTIYMPYFSYICRFFILSAIFSIYLPFCKIRQRLSQSVDTKRKGRWNNLKLHVMGFRLINKHMIRRV